jgi:hypothetical protein
MAHTLQRNTPHGTPIMISLVLAAVIAAGAINIALVAFLADRLGPKTGTLSAGEFAAVADATSATRGAVRVGNENASVLAARRAA